MSLVLQKAVYVIQASVLVGCSECCGHFVKDVWGAKLGGALCLQLFVTHEKILSILVCPKKGKNFLTLLPEQLQFTEHQCHPSLPLPDRIWGPLNFRHFSKIAKKKAIICVVSIRPSVHLSLRLSLRVEQIGSHSKGYHEILYLRIFSKFLSRIFKV